MSDVRLERTTTCVSPRGPPKMAREAMRAKKGQFVELAFLETNVNLQGTSPWPPGDVSSTEVLA
ncbi:MAG TPA: hypothetical protein VGX78_06435, partial [Pirellulales bacterium]|nr:hypothetical protein [Pirellulales bacterium]